ncbi:MAG: ATP-binding protein [Treponema sp.]|nr:ATP-binding protein [Treponema sp.]
MDKIIGRKAEVKQVLECFESDKSELVSVYGRRRVGKTFLIKECFDEEFDFWFTGIYKATRVQHLTQFQNVLNEKSGTKIKKLQDWFQAFEVLKNYLLSLNKDKVVVFLDEIPWMDTPKSNFLAAFSYFWNMWPSNKTLLKLYVCGSATTWMINKFVGDKGGLYGRTSCSIYLAPFNLGETEEFLKKVKQIEMNRHQILELYMILGGIPYYLDMLRKDLPLTKNIDNLFFKENTNLKTEYEFLFRSLFKDSKNYRKVVEALSEKKKGLSREEIKEATHIKEGGTLTEILSNLAQCDFIREYNAIGKEKRDSLFQLTDLFTLFYLNFVQKGSCQDENFWSNFAFPGHKNSWAGYSFEQVCFHHIKQIKSKLSILGVLSSIYSWSCKGFVDKDGAKWSGGQIDMLIDRNDEVINICEIKYSSDEYAITDAYEETLRKRASLFKKVTKTKKLCSIPS